MEFCYVALVIILFVFISHMMFNYWIPFFFSLVKKKKSNDEYFDSVLENIISLKDKQLVVNFSSISEGKGNILILNGDKSVILLISMNHSNDGTDIMYSVLINDKWTYLGRDVVSYRPSQVVVDMKKDKVIDIYINNEFLREINHSKYITNPSVKIFNSFGFYMSDVSISETA